MLQLDRYEKIMQILQKQKRVSAQYLAQNLYVSNSTIRRDLQEMEKKGMINRVWGGATVVKGKQYEPPVYFRAHDNQNKKEIIAACASSFIKDGMTIFMDASSTLQYLIPYLDKFARLTVITCGLNIQRLLYEKSNVTVHLLGGQVFEGSYVAGHIAQNNVQQYFADLFFFSCGGISPDSGITSPDARIVAICQEMMKRAKAKILLCDSTKVEMNYLWTISPFQEIDYVIMDNAMENQELTAILGNKLIIASKQ